MDTFSIAALAINDRGKKAPVSFHSAFFLVLIYLLLIIPLASIEFRHFQVDAGNVK